MGENKKRSPLPMTKVDLAMKTLKKWWLMLKNTKLQMTNKKKGFQPKMDLNPIVSTLNQQLKMKNSKIEYLNLIVKSSWKNVLKSSTGWIKIKLLKLMNFKTSKKKLKAFVSQS